MPTDGKHNQLVAEGNSTLTEDAIGTCIHQLFEEQVERTPEAVAVVCEDKQLTYQELNHRANQLARYLVKHGVGPEALVGICMGRSLDMVIGLLGILKAGGAYVPLDSDYPKERLAFMLEDSRARVLLTTVELAAKLPAHDALIIQLDRDWGLISQESGESLSSKATAPNAAYIAYTSGSTGQPKGVILTHSNLYNYIRSIRTALGITESDLYLHTASFAFASSVRPLMVPLSCGATVLIATHEQIISPDALFHLIKDKGVTILDGVASYLRTITYTLASLPLDSRTSLLRNNLRLVLSSGEPLSSDIARTWSREFDHPAQLNNMYGQTEVAGTIAVNPISRQYDSETKVLPVGHPIPNSQMYVLDASLDPVATGIVGEVYTGGPAVARGYLNGPKLTAEKFVPNPFSEQPGSRIFKTGDLARRLSDGTFEIVGRTDQQVKIRGLRIELGEIEAVLKEHQAIREAVVLASEDQTNEKRLLAYLVAADDQAPVIGGRKRYRLPNGMAIVQQNNNETDYLYEEIFVNNIYLRNGVSLPKGACIVDAGANIGMFSMFVSRCVPDAHIYAFEPIAPVFEALRINTKLYGKNVKVFQQGISDSDREETFTYYPRHTMMSGISAYANAEDEVEVVKKYMRNAQQRGSAGMAQMLEQADELLAGRFEGESHACHLRRLSDVIREENIERIDLLKIDVQRAELDALRGLAVEDWRKINQIVMEVHDWSGQGGKGQIDTIVTLLEGHGFKTTVEQDELLKGTDRYTLYAIRTSQTNSVKAQAELDAVHSLLLSDTEAPLLNAGELRNYLGKSLPAYMVPAAFIFLEQLPRTPNGKIDRKALPALDENALQARAAYMAPRTPQEELMAGIWMEVLGVNNIGIHDNFFELGGHSLSATKVMSRVRKVFGVELPVRKLFELPTVADLSSRLLQAGLEEHSLSLPLKAASRKEALPLSFSQQRLWFLNQLEPGNSSYNAPRAIRMKGRLMIAALSQSLDEIVHRHESLRTTFIVVNDSPVQRISESFPAQLYLTDLEYLPVDEREAEARRLIGQEAMRPFDLSEGPLFRACLLRLDEEDHVFLLTMHHIISDGWSMDIVFKELTTLYESFTANKTSRLPELTIQYADYSVWQREWLQAGVLEKQLSYWKKQLAGAPPLLELSIGKPRPTIQTHNGAHQSVKLPRELWEELKNLAQREGVTPYMLLLAAFQVLLSIYAGREDIVVGSPIAGRNRTEIEGLVGFFVNSLVLRVNLSGNPRFRELLERVREVCLEAYAHQDLPFEKLVEELQPGRNFSYSPMFQVLFALQNAPASAFELEGLKLTAFGFDDNTTRFDLEAHLWERSDSLICSFVYNTDLFDAATVAQLATHYRRLLESVVAGPEEQISELQLLTEAEREKLLVEWNATEAGYPRDKTIAELFGEQVERTPEAVAVVFNGEQVSYRELNERANQLAHYLQSRGVGPDTLVGLCLNKSVEMIVAMLATLKAGGAYLPMDPNYPRERLRFMVEDSGVAYLVSTESLVGSVPQKVATTILLDAERQEIKAQSQSTPDNKSTPNNLIYCIYTSGSTGQPKGVLLEHRNVVRLLVNEQQLFSFSEQDVWTMFHSYCFDFSVWEMYGALLYGGKLVIVAEPVMKDPSLFLELLVEQKVTVLNQTPTAFYNLVQEALRSGPAALSLRYVIFGGEALHPVQLKEWKQAYPETKLINMYGITETTVHVTYKEITDQDIAENRSNIGRPIPTTTTYVMDGKLRLQPVGVVGEICVGGEGVGRGYLGREELTRQKFVANPYRPQERLYRSGDLGKLLPDGELIYIGRIDDQVQIRGFRVEPGEIKSHLLEHPLVAEAEVVARESKSESVELVAYVVPRSEISLTALRNHLAETLPFYMVPTAFVMLEALPLTANGKVDRQALPDPDETRPEIEATFVAPRTANEEVLTKIWGEILGLEQVGVFDNFFELGGHSLLATQVVSRINDMFEVRVPLRAFFEQPTVAGLADFMINADQLHRETIPAIRRLPRA